MKHRFVLGLLAGALSLSMMGCTAEVKPAKDPAPTTAGETTTSTTTATTAPVTQPTAPAPDPATRNPLTGRYESAPIADSRPVAVMIGNNDRSRPQIGLSAADWYVEAETEGGITRIMAVFASADRVPAQLCPIRSARTPFIKLAGALDAVYVHAGGSEAGLAMLGSTRQDAVNALMNHGSTFWRDANLRAQKGLEYSLSTGGDKLKTRLSELNKRATTDRLAYTFSEDVVAGTPCTELTAVYSGAQSVRFVYDAATGQYSKYHAGRGGNFTRHVDAANNPIEAANVILMYDTKYAENETTIGFTLSAGEGIICAGGQMREIQWQRTDSGLTFTEKGQPVSFLPGKTYICLINKNNKASTVVR